jgi:hypothetical protein
MGSHSHSQKSTHPPPLTADEVRAFAAAERIGLMLSSSSKSSSETGFKGGSKDRGLCKVQTSETGRLRHLPSAELGTYQTPEEAAMCYARYATPANVHLTQALPAAKYPAISSVSSQALPAAKYPASASAADLGDQTQRPSTVASAVASESDACEGSPQAPPSSPLAPHQFGSYGVFMGPPNGSSMAHEARHAVAMGLPQHHPGWTGYEPPPPSMQPSIQPSMQPSIQPSIQPSMQPCPPIGSSVGHEVRHEAAPQYALFPPNPFVNGLESQEQMGRAVMGTFTAVADPRESLSQPPPQAMQQGGATTLAPLSSSCSERVDAVFTAAYAVAGAANAIAAARQYSKPYGTSAPAAPATAPVAPATAPQAAARYRWEPVQLQPAAVPGAIKRPRGRPPKEKKSVERVAVEAAAAAAAANAVAATMQHTASSASSMQHTVSAQHYEQLQAQHYKQPQPQPQPQYQQQQTEPQYQQQQQFQQFQQYQQQQTQLQQLRQQQQQQQQQAPPMSSFAPFGNGVPPSVSSFAPFSNGAAPPPASTFSPFSNGVAPPMASSLAPCCNGTGGSSESVWRG